MVGKEFGPQDNRDFKMTPEYWDGHVSGDGCVHTQEFYIKNIPLFLSRSERRTAKERILEYANLADHPEPRHILQGEELDPANLPYGALVGYRQERWSPKSFIKSIREKVLDSEQIGMVIKRQKRNKDIQAFIMYAHVSGNSIFFSSQPQPNRILNGVVQHLETGSSEVYLRYSNVRVLDYGRGQEIREPESRFAFLKGSLRRAK